MANQKQAIAAAEFAKRWVGKGYEKGESQVFWTELLTQVYGVETPSTFITFEQQARLDHTSFIDVLIPSTHVMIEQKSIDKDINKPIRQSDGTLLTPFQQAQRYSAVLPYSQRPRWIVICNFKEFAVHDMENPNGEPYIILLKNLGKEYYRLQFLVEQGNEHIQKEMEVSMKAGETVGKLFDALIKQYIDPTKASTMRSLNILCVRLVFCLYAEDANIFGRHDMFHDFLVKFDVDSLREQLIKLFQVLNTKPEDRDPYMRSDLAEFPYVSGGLFDEDIEIPRFTEEIRTLLLKKASMDFDWSLISPTIFGAVFESTLNPESRRSGGMHYTSIENIHKVIDPLFLDDLNEEFATIMAEPIIKQRRKMLVDYQNKLASLTFLDPACGSGNFLTETYLSLRRLENKVIEELQGGQVIMGTFINPIKVNINQFYGIEINDFAVTVATTALWISEAQMIIETERIIHQDIDFLPLKNYPNIYERNALRTDWETVVPKEQLNYIIGNPPFVGYAYQSAGQKKDLEEVCPECGKNIDYVAGWYYKTARMMENTCIHAALVSTNSICQGEQVAAIWKNLFNLYNIRIDFAYKTFVWDNEASQKAHVHCVIVGFSNKNVPSPKPRFLIDNGIIREANNINPYLIDAPTVFIESRAKPISQVPEMIKGSSPVDGGNLIIEAEDYKDFLNKEPEAEKYVKRYVGAREFLHNIPRYCLWLEGISPQELMRLSLVRERVAKTRDFRLASKKSATRKFAEMPTRFMEMRQPDDDYIIVPRVSSENRRYIPLAYMTGNVICSDSNIIIPHITLYHFGIITSNVHMAWMRTVCGRLKSDYRYSNTIVYNNFPWPTPTEEQKTKIEHTAQAILDLRAKYTNSSLADLYDELAMPPDLRLAHRENDRAVMAAYGFPAKMTESECVAALFNLYSELTKAKE